VTRVALRPRAAFTLIELLVVVTIIGLLIAILLPSLSKARQQSKSAVCLANLKRIGTQGAVYVNDFGAYPPVRLKKFPGQTGMEDYYHDIGNEFRRKAPRWQWFLSDDIGWPINPNNYDSEEEFNDSLVIDGKYWEDPAMVEFTNDIRNGAYGYNGTYLGNTRDDGKRWIRFPVRDTMVRPASDTVFAADSRGGSSPHGNHSYWLDPPKKAKYGELDGEEQPFSPNPSEPLEELGQSPVERRHLGKGNVAFCDGHAATMTLQALGYQVNENGGDVVPVDDIDRTKAANRLWTGTGKDDPPGEFGEE